MQSLFKIIDGFVIMLIIIYDDDFFTIDQLMAYLASCYSVIRDGFNSLSKAIQHELDQFLIQESPFAGNGQFHP